MVKAAQNNGLKDRGATNLEKFVIEHINIFRTSVPSGQPASVKLLKIVLTMDANPAHNWLRRYSKDQLISLDDCFPELVCTGTKHLSMPSP